MIYQNLTKTSVLLHYFYLTWYNMIGYIQHFLIILFKLAWCFTLIYVYIYIYICISMYVYTHTHTHTHTHTNTHTHTHTHRYIYIYIYIHCKECKEMMNLSQCIQMQCGQKNIFIELELKIVYKALKILCNEKAILLTLY